MKKTLLISLLLSVIIGCSPEGKFNNIDEVEIYYDDAHDYYRATKRMQEFSDLFNTYSSAIGKFEDVRYVTAPNRKFENERLYVRAAIDEISCYIKKEEYKDAIVVAKEWVNDYPSSRSYQKLGRLYDKKFGKDRVIELYKEGINKNVMLYGLLADIYTKQKEYDLALQIYKERNKQGGEYYTSIAEIYELQNEYELAKQILIDASQIVENKKEFYYKKILTLAENNDKYSDIKTYLNELIQLNPTEESYRIKKINYYFDNDSYRLAELQINSAARYIDQFDKELWLSKLYSKYINFKWDNSYFSLSTNRTASYLVKLINGRYIKIRNNSIFKLKNINITINSTYTYVESNLYPDDYEEIQCNLFADNYGVRFDNSEYAIKELEIAFDVYFNGTTVAKKVYYKF